MKSISLSLSIFTFIIVLCSCNSVKNEDDFITEAFSHAEKKLAQLSELAKEQNKNPRNCDLDGNIGWIGENYDWTEGFFSGSLWLMYEATRDPKWKEKAAYFQDLYKSHKDQKNDHDLGFIFNCSYGNGLKLTNNQDYKQVVVDASNSLMKSYNPSIGLIMSWDVSQAWVKKLGWQYPVIIDNMMNLEMLFEASKMTGDEKYYQAAVSHANKTLENHFRDDFSTYHVLDYDSINGQVRSKQTNQGYADESAWARGQTWGLYGYTMCYRYTNDERYLNRAKEIARFLLNHPNLPEDKIPYWDFDSPDIPEAKRDASSAAIMASALLELNQYVEGDEMQEMAALILKNLFEGYTTTETDKSAFLLKHCVGNMPINSEIDVSINYADYYYLEALLRLKQAKF